VAKQDKDSIAVVGADGNEYTDFRVFLVITFCLNRHDEEVRGRDSDCLEQLRTLYSKKPAVNCSQVVLISNQHYGVGDVP